MYKPPWLTWDFFLFILNAEREREGERERDRERQRERERERESIEEEMRVCLSHVDPNKKHISNIFLLIEYIDMVNAKKHFS